MKNSRPGQKKKMIVEPLFRSHLMGSQVAQDKKIQGHWLVVQRGINPSPYTEIYTHGNWYSGI